MDDTSCKDDEGNDDKESRGSKLKRKRGLEENEADTENVDTADPDRDDCTVEGEEENTHLMNVSVAQVETVLEVTEVDSDRDDDTAEEHDSGNIRLNCFPFS